MVLSALLPHGPGTGYALMPVFTGSEAMERLDSLPFLPDIVLLDMNLTDVDALEVCRSIRSRFSCLELPVILMASKETDERQSIMILDAGANDIITKPIRRCGDGGAGSQVVVCWMSAISCRTV